jgi:hypothetical protein
LNVYLKYHEIRFINIVLFLTKKAYSHGGLRKLGKT